LGISDYDTESKESVVVKVSHKKRLRRICKPKKNENQPQLNPEAVKNAKTHSSFLFDAESGKYLRETKAGFMLSPYQPDMASKFLWSVEEIPSKGGRGPKYFLVDQEGLSISFPSNGNSARVQVEHEFNIHGAHGLKFKLPGKGYLAFNVESNQGPTFEWLQSNEPPWVIRTFQRVDPSRMHLENAGKVLGNAVNDACAQQ